MLSKTKFWKSSDNGLTNSKTSFISNDVRMFSSNKIMFFAKRLAKEKVGFSQKEWKWYLSIQLI